MTRIVVGRRSGVVTIPVNALFRDGETWAVFVAARGRAQLRPVEVGLKTPLQAEVNGIDEGMRVILHPSDKITDGVRIEADR